MLLFVGREERGIPMNEKNIIRHSKEKILYDIYNCTLKTEAFSVIGTRKSQQDFAGIVENKNGVFAVICDGMGGMLGGERASKETVNQMICSFTDEFFYDAEDFLKKEAIKADERVSGLMDEYNNPLNAGTTVVSVILSEGMFHWMSVGDSRIYLLREKKLIKITRDHNYREKLKELFQKGKITREVFEKECCGKLADALTSYLGMGGIKEIDISQEPLRLKPNDQILLCSDGLYKSLSNEQIEAMMIDNQIEPWISIKRLVEMAGIQAKKSQDNTTAILIKYEKMAGEEK